MADSVNLDDLIERIHALPSDWHRAGSVGRDVLRAIVEHAPRDPRLSVETGCGKTTLLISHLSQRHMVFTRDDGGPNDGGSLAAVNASPLLHRGVAEFVVGSTQQTLTCHSFDAQIDLCVLDGPHAWPFPELEYYAVYPHVASGGLLVLDDIHIPTINHMWRFLLEDPMFEQLAVIDTTAFLRRTSAPVFSPICDGWENQPFNATRFPVDIDTRLRARVRAQIVLPVKRSIVRALPHRAVDAVRRLRQRL